MSVMGAPRIVVLAIMLLVLSACGSQLDPNTVAKVNGAAGGTAGDPAAPGATVGDGGVDPGAAPGAVDPETGAGSGGTGSAAGAASGGGGGTGGAPAPTGKGSATGGVKAASCDGLKNQTGVTEKEITVANVADISGPVPGLFEIAQQSVRAYVQYFNSTSSICGRKLNLITLDSRTDAGGDQQAYIKACEQSFAAIGSMGGFDDGGAKTAQSCGLPDVRAMSVMPERQKCTTCFGVYALNTGKLAESGPKWLMSRYPDATANVGVLYTNAGAAPPNAKAQASAWAKIGWKIKYQAGIDVAEFNYAPYVQQLKAKGVKMVVFTGPYQNTIKLQQAMKQQGYKPDVYLQDPAIYDQAYIDQAGDLAEGAHVYTTTAMFEDRGNAELQLYQAWLQQVKPGAKPNFFGLYAWSASRLFVEKAIALGGKLTRPALIDAMRKTTAWTGHGAHVPQKVGTGETPPCQMIIQYKAGKWQKISPGAFLCGRMVSS